MAQSLINWSEGGTPSASNRHPLRWEHGVPIVCHGSRGPNEDPQAGHLTAPITHCLQTNLTQRRAAPQWEGRVLGTSRVQPGVPGCYQYMDILIIGYKSSDFVCTSNPLWKRLFYISQYYYMHFSLFHLVYTDWGSHFPGFVAFSSPFFTYNLHFGIRLFLNFTYKFYLEQETAQQGVSGLLVCNAKWA